MNSEEALYHAYCAHAVGTHRFHLSEARWAFECTWREAMLADSKIEIMRTIGTGAPFVAYSAAIDRIVQALWRADPVVVATVMGRLPSE